MPYTFGTQAITPIYLTIGQPVPSIRLTGADVPAGTYATLQLVGTTTPIIGSIVVENSLTYFKANYGQTVPRGATLGANAATLSATGATNATITTDVNPTVVTPDCNQSLVSYSSGPCASTHVISDCEGRYDYVTIETLAGSTLVANGASSVTLSLPTYADNAAAVTGGLAVGRLYKTATGEVRIVV